MPLIPEETIERVKSAIDVVDIISEHVQLRQQGRNWVGLCPFHNENSPSFNVNPELQFFHCFGCGIGGDVFRFLMEIDKVSFVEAVTFLAARAGIALPRHGGAAEDERNDRLYQANDLASKYFAYMLQQPAGADARRYLRQRGLTEATIDAFGLGYAPGGWTAFVDMATAPRRGFQPAELEAAGLAAVSRKGTGHYDRFRDRVMFPIANLSGRTIAFGARALRPDDEPKYLNSPETAIYHKGGVLYNLARAREAVRRLGTAIVVEGYMDVVSLVQAGVDHVIASSGTALTEPHARLLGRYAERVVLLFDGDAAGGTAAARGVEVLLATDLDTRIATLPPGDDPDTFVGRPGGADALRALVDQAPPALDVYLDRQAAHADLTSVAGRARAIERLIPLFAQCREEVRKDLMLRRVAQRFDVDEQALRHDVAAAVARPRRAAGSAAPRPGDAAPGPPAATGNPATVEDPLEREFAGLLLQHPRLLPATRDHLDLEVFTDGAVRRLLVDLLATGDGSRLDLTALLGRVDADLARLVAAGTMLGFDPERVDELWGDHVLRLQRTHLTRQIEAAARRMRLLAQTPGTEEELGRVQARHNELLAARKELEAQRST